MSLDSASFISRSNSDLLMVKMLANNVHMSAGARMIAIAEYVANWDKATDNCPPRYGAVKELKARQSNGTQFGSI